MLGVVFYAVKMYLTCGLMLKKKLLPLMIALVVMLNHLGFIHLWRPQKNDQFCDPHPLYLQKWTIDPLLTNKKICRLKINFNTPSPFPFSHSPSMWTSKMYGPLVVCFDITFFSVLEKLCCLKKSCCLNETSQSSKFCSKTFLSHKTVNRQSK